MEKFSFVGLIAFFTIKRPGLLPLPSYLNVVEFIVPRDLPEFN